MGRAHGIRNCSQSSCSSQCEAPWDEPMASAIAAKFLVAANVRLHGTSPWYPQYGSNGRRCDSNMLAFHECRIRDQYLVDVINTERFSCNEVQRVSSFSYSFFC